MTSKIIVTLVGKDHAGIIAAVCNYFAQNDINILDLSMTTVQDFINMILVVDVDKYKKTFPGLVNDLDRIGEEVGCKVTAQKEEVFSMMHRI
ncbi:MAG: ACT domain-containing protein [archaeon]|nr:ACT domain-containing protein [archaeon]